MRTPPQPLQVIYTSGYTRIPVYQTKRSRVVGIIFAKDLILVDPNDEIPVSSFLSLCPRAVNAAHCKTTLQLLMNEMQSSRTHMWFVSTSATLDGAPQRSASSLEEVHMSLACTRTPA